ncbi:hypothetical protein GGQ18_002926 [Salinibacter ruber]|nr:hypothetical protein [Salinibacter ruber]
MRTESVLLLSSLNFVVNRAEEEKKKRRYVNPPNGRVHLEGGAVSRKRWMEMLNDADLWKQSTRRRKKFGESGPETFEMVDSPSEPFVGIGRVPSEAQRSKTTYVVEME